MGATRSDGEAGREVSALSRLSVFVPTIVTVGILIALLTVIWRVFDDVYVPAAKDLARDPFVLDGFTDLRGIYGNRDVCSEVFSYRIALSELAPLPVMLQEKVRAQGWVRAKDIGDSYCFRCRNMEVRVRHDRATSTVFVGWLDSVSTNSSWADANVWPLLR